MLADLARDLVVLVDEADDDGEVRRIGLAVRRGLKCEWRGLELDDDGHEAGAIAFGKPHRASPHREGVRERLLLHGAKSRRFPGVHGRSAGIAHGEVAPARGHGDARSFDLDLNLAEPPVVDVVGRRVPEQVVVAKVVSLSATKPCCRLFAFSKSRPPVSCASCPRLLCASDAGLPRSSRDPASRRPPPPSVE